MHDELMSSVDISQKLTSCAIVPIDGQWKHLNGMNDIQTNDNDSNDSAINDMNGTDSMNTNTDNTDLKAKNEESIKSLVISELSNEDANHICDHFNRDNQKASDNLFADESNGLPNSAPNGVNCDERTDQSSDEVLPNGLKVIDGCVEPPYDPPADKCLRFTNQLQFLRTVMTKYLCRYKTALPFLKPVNCNQLKIPDYYKVVTNPMDLQTIKRRMMCLWYSSAADCLEDFKLMFNNCFKFNSCDNYVYKAGKKLEEYLEEKLKEMPKDEVEIACPPKQTAVEMERRAAKRRPESSTQELHDLQRGAIAQTLGPDANALLVANSAKKPTTRSEHGIQRKKPSKELPETIASPPVPQPKRVQLNTSMKFCLEIIKELLTKKHREYAWPFYEPVSTQQYPDYLEIIKKPIDLTTIKTKIETGQYKKVKPFVKDFRLMITNCLRYNKPEAPVIEQAKRVRDYFEYRYAKIPEELLTEKMTSNQNNTHSSHNTNNSTENQSKHKNKEHKETEPEIGSIGHQRMKLLETQVQLLSSTISALTGIDTKLLKPKNGQKKTNNGRGRKPANNKQTRGRPSNKKSPKTVVEDDDDEEEEDNLYTSPSPIAFNHEDMDDLQQLKTDLENLDAKDLKNVLRILRQTEPSIKCDNDENIEIDFEVLKPETLIALRKFVSSCMLNNTKKKSKSSLNGSDSSKKRSNCDIKNGNPFAGDPSTSRLSDSSSDSESDSESDSDDD